MLIRAIDRADVTVWPMALQADLLLWPGFVRNVDGTIEIPEHGVIQLFYTIELGLEVSSRAGTNMAFDARHLRMRGVLSRHKLRLHWHVTALTTKIEWLRILISLVTDERGQKKKTNSADRKQGKDAPV